MLVVQLQRPDGDAHECGEPVDLGGDKSRVVVAHENEHEERGRPARYGKHRAAWKTVTEAARRPRCAAVCGEALAARDGGAKERRRPVLERWQVEHGRRDRTKE